MNTAAWSYIDGILNLKQNRTDAFSKPAQKLARRQCSQL